MCLKLWDSQAHPGKASYTTARNALKFLKCFRQLQSNSLGELRDQVRILPLWDASDNEYGIFKMAKTEQVANLILSGMNQTVEGDRRLG